MLRECGYDTVTERRLFALHLALPSDLPAQLGLPPGNFVCLLAWDARGIPVEVVSTFVERLLTAGARYFVCWGPDCERVHDIIDEVDADPSSEFGAPDGSVIMTTWHSREPLSEALWFFLRCATPDDHYFARHGFAGVRPVPLTEGGDRAQSVGHVSHTRNHHARPGRGPLGL